MTDQEIVQKAMAILQRRFRRNYTLSSPDVARDYFKLKLSEFEHEVFCVVFLDSQHRVLDHQVMFRGTVDGASVYPREVIKECMKLNATAVIFNHNHPSGVAEPSMADDRITQRLKDALSMIDVRVLDHFIIGGGKHYSYAEHGKL